MKKCRCCRQSWPEEFFTVCRPDGLRRARCNACRRHCGVARSRHRVALTRAWKAHLRASVEQVRLARARAMWDNTGVGSSDESNTIADGTRVLATTRDAGVIAFRGSSS